MSNAQQIEHQPGQQQDAAAPATETADSRDGLRADLHAQILRMTPADAGALAEMIQNYPSFLGAILAVAASHMGNAAVQRAIQLAKSWKAQGRSGALSQGEVHQATGDSHPLSGSEMIAALHDESDGPQKTGPAAAPRAAQAAAEPAWVAGARAYNAAHAELVDEFNELTSDVCRLDGAGKVDPQAVARWQSNHGLAADGKIGPHTVAAARKLKAKPPEVAAAPQ
ncbi:MAG TPA: hypothetical protein VF516_21195, partial [Kofleriaceae bacterium]